MFTGIVEDMGTVLVRTELDSSETGGGGFALTIANALVLEDVHLGDSIAVNGTCLTVTEFSADRTSFKVGIAPETLRKTNLGELVVGAKVNLERAMQASTRFGGHYVQGHVDTVVEIVDIAADPPNSRVFTFLVPKNSTMDFLSLIVSKGYVCLDGVSLTVTAVDWVGRTFSVMLIAYTQERVVLNLKQIGATVNLEVDQMGKLIESQLVNLLQNEKSAVYQMVDAIIQRRLDHH